MALTDVRIRSARLAAPVRKLSDEEGFSFGFALLEQEPRTAASINDARETLATGPKPEGGTRLSQAVPYAPCRPPIAGIGESSTAGTGGTA